MNDYDKMADQLASRMSALLAEQPSDLRSRSMDDVADLLAQAGFASHLDRSSPRAFTRSLFQRGRSLGARNLFTRHCGGTPIRRLWARARRTWSARC
jgi:hypothetical protein